MATPGDVEGSVGQSGLPHPATAEGARELIEAQLERVDLELTETAAFLKHFQDRRALTTEDLEEARGLRQDVLNHLSRVAPADVAQAIDREQQAALKNQLAEVAAERYERRREELERLRQDLLRVHGALDEPAEEWVGQPAASTGQIFEIIEEERMRIARDLHDGPAQSMANLVLQSEVLDRLVSKPEKLRAELDGFKEAVRTALDDTRRFIFDLRPMTLDDLGLVPTLTRFLQERQERSGIRMELSVTGEERRLPGAMESVLFRIIQEAVNNAQRHAQATSIEVSITHHKQRVTARVKDDGVGFEVVPTMAGALAHKHLGLISMQERTAQLNGRLEIRSQPGEGTEVVAEFALGAPRQA